MKALAAVLLALLAAPAFAGECLISPPVATNRGLGAVAPELQRAANADLLCVSADEALVRIQAQQAAAVGADRQYVKQTEFDNSPYRFDMSQDGRRMTAEEFEAWMKAKGIHVAKGKPAAEAAAAEVPPATPPPKR